MPEHYWPSPDAQIRVMASAYKWGVDHDDIIYVLSLAPHQLLTFGWGYKDPHLDWAHGGRTTRVEAMTTDGYKVELVLRRDGFVAHERCLVLHAMYI